MRKSLLEIEEINRYLFQQMPVAERLFFQARMIISHELKQKVNAQVEVHQTIQWYGRNEKRRQLNELHEYLMSDQTFKATISAIFK